MRVVVKVRCVCWNWGESWRVMDERRDDAICDALAKVFVLKSRDVFLANSDVTRIADIVALIKVGDIRTR